MAADYWKSTSNKYWMFKPAEIAELRAQTELRSAKIIDQYPLPDRRLIFIYIKDQLLHLGKRLAVRQQTVATALVYLHRFYLYNAIQAGNPYQLLATAFYLASKTDESPHHIRLVASEARATWPEFVPAEVSRIGELEFCLISEMHSQLIVWHPYRTLIALKDNSTLKLSNVEYSLAWSIVNDTFMTDLPLTYPPNLIAITAVFLAVTFAPSKAMTLSRSSPLNQGFPRNNAVAQQPATFDTFGGQSGLSTAFSQAIDTVQDQAVPSTATKTTTVDSTQKDVSHIKKAIVSAAKASEKMQNLIKFIALSGLSIQQMVAITQEIIRLYEIWETYNSNSVRDAIAQCLRGQRLET